MFKEIEFKDIEKSETFKYAKKLDFFKNNTKVEFQPGLNILFAPNGTGKSTLLKMLAQVTASEQGGVSTLTSSWKNDVFGFGEKNKLEGINVIHDGQPTMYSNPRTAIGLVGGMAGFDDDFFDQGLAEVQNKQSTGLTTLGRMGKIIQTIAGDMAMPKEFDKRISLDTETIEMIRAKMPVGQQTIILDEPESGVGIQIQQKLYDMMEKGAKDNNLQIIVATHSPFALACDANFIELQPGYLEMSRLYIQALGSRIDAQREEKIKKRKEEKEELNNSKHSTTTKKKID